MDRGIFSTIYVRPKPSVTANQVRECLCGFYRGSNFVRVVGSLAGEQACRPYQLLRHLGPRERRLDHYLIDARQPHQRRLRAPPFNA